MKTMVTFFKMLVLIGWMGSAVSLGYAQETLKIRFLTSEFPPYNYTVEGGTVTGFNTVIVQAVLQELGITARPRLTLVTPDDYDQF